MPTTISFSRGSIQPLTMKSATMFSLRMCKALVAYNTLLRLDSQSLLDWAVWDWRRMDNLVVFTSFFFNEDCHAICPCLSYLILKSILNAESLPFLIFFLLLSKP